MFRYAPLFLLIAPAATCAADWPQFRGPAADGHSPAKNVPVKWNQTDNVAWKSEIPGRGWSSPVMQNGRIFLTTAVVTDGSDESNAKADRSLRTLCLDASNGRILWDVEVFKQQGASSPATIHQKNGHASPTPIITNDRLYVHFGHQGCAALDLTGKKLWENRSFKYPPRHGAGASPVLVEDLSLIHISEPTRPY